MIINGVSDCIFFNKLHSLHFNLTLPTYYFSFTKFRIEQLDQLRTPSNNRNEIRNSQGLVQAGVAGAACPQVARFGAAKLRLLNANKQFVNE